MVAAFRIPDHSLGNGLTGKLAFFPNRNKGLMEAVSNRTPKIKPLGFCSCDHIHVHILKTFLYGINGKLQAVGILQNTGHITEK